MLELPLIAFVNHLLAREQWARERLAPFGGSEVRLRLAPLPDLVLAIATGGTVAAGAGDRVALTLGIAPTLLPRVLVREEAALGEVQVDGDTELANAIRFLFGNLRWDVEEDLSRVVGDAAAHRLAGTARAFAAWQRDAVERLGENVAEYLKEEADILVHPHELARFGTDVEALRDAVERLEKRVARLEPRARGEA